MFDKPWVWTYIQAIELDFNSVIFLVQKKQLKNNDRFYDMINI